ncbi:KTSC domain-containing protein [Mesorhizobium sp. ZC-5]|uniref:KTSC domain-containing protein n=1 Tax=Mesorhizobium sp. ZC-5 TaxID=2986066 RepID=UPI0021E722D6|nr:KTSC domain-containing protein [Mesorhizobium sp. ZC-5]MCV3239781.1 KTSC domain-containing protein [Mesorhizobium sp. ZC-5]
MPPIRSSAISFVEYHDISRTMEITFKSGRIYNYYDVPREVYEDFLASSSKGGFFNDHIKDNYSER